MYVHTYRTYNLGLAGLGFELPSPAGFGIVMLMFRALELDICIFAADVSGLEVMFEAKNGVGLELNFIPESEAPYTAP